MLFRSLVSFKNHAIKGNSDVLMSVDVSASEGENYTKGHICLCSSNLSEEYYKYIRLSLQFMAPF